MRLLWLPDVLRDAGMPIRVLSGWETRGRSLTIVRGLVWHDTVTTRSWTDDRVDRLLRDGRSDLKGPLSQLGMDRSGTFVIVASGRASHNGYGAWGNSSIGCEVYCAGGLRGREEPYNAVQREHAAIGGAAILARLGRDESRAQGHKEQDPTRKIDPYGVDMDRLRAQTRVRLDDPKGWDEMATVEEIKGALREVMTEDDYLVAHDDKQWLVREREGLAVWIRTGEDFNRLRQAYPHRGEADSLGGLEVIA